MWVERRDEVEDLFERTSQKICELVEIIGSGRTQEIKWEAGKLAMEVCDEVSKWPEIKPYFGKEEKGEHINVIRIGTEKLSRGIDVSIEAASDVCTEIYKLERQLKSILGDL
jgi:hypothetical protein